MKGLYFVTDRGLVVAGADSVAVVSAICAAPDPFTASRELTEIIRAALAKRATG